MKKGEKVYIYKKKAHLEDSTESFQPFCSCSKLFLFGIVVLENLKQRFDRIEETYNKYLNQCHLTAIKEETSEATI